MFPRAWRPVGLVAITTWTGATACHASATHEAAPELDRALKRIVPATARSVTSPSYDAGPFSVSGSREFVTDMTWNEYVAFLAGALSPDWTSPDDGGLNASTRHFTKSTSGDAYFLDAEDLNGTWPVHVRVSVRGVPD